jgi:acyl carrier protein
MRTDQEQARQIVEAALRRVAPEGDVSRIPPEDDFREHLDIDSVAFLSFADEVQQRTGLKIPDRDFPLLTTVNGCIDYLTSHTR